MSLKPLILIFLAIVIAGCEEDPEYDYIPLNQGELYTYVIANLGDEEIAYIIKQAYHFKRSEIVRDSSTNWSAVYYYVPEEDYVGYDYVVIETCKQGANLQCDEKKITTLRFEILE